MDNTKSTQDVNTSHTSDGVARSNMMTREEFLHRVLYSGEVTQIAQHLAVVIFLVAEGKNQLNLSLRDLERITGWSRRAISDHLSELEVFVKVTLGTGRAKALFELQGAIEDAIASAVVGGSRAPNVPTKTVVVRQAPTSVVEGQAPTNFVVAGYTPKSRFVATHVAASVMAGLAATTGAMASQPPTNIAVESQAPTNSAVVAGQATTSDVVVRQAPTNPSSYRGEGDYNIPISSPPYKEPPAENSEFVRVNGAAIHGPGFTLPFAAIDMAATLIGMPAERARAVATICAHGWAANKTKPSNPMAQLNAAITSQHNRDQVMDAKLSSAKAPSKPATGESRAARLLRHVEQAADKKGGRS